MPKAYVEAYGCSSNLADKEAVIGILKKEKFLLVEDPASADINIILTCTVKIPTINRMLHRIRKLTEIKKPLIVLGCLTKVRKNDIEKINPSVSLISPDWIDCIGTAAHAALKGKRTVVLEDADKQKLMLPRERTNPVVAIVQIAKGCLSNCTYCSEPYRGKLFSYPIECIQKEIERSLAEGCKEVWLTSLDNGCYGFDLGTNLAKLLNIVYKLDGKFFVRVGMANPAHILKILNDLVEAHKNEKIFKFLHMPIQSASDRILALMKREYRLKDFIKIVKTFKKEFPCLTLATDIIVGFPTESDKDFRKTLNFIKRFKPDVVNISKFGLHSNTVAANMPQVDNSIINKRAKEIFELVREVQMEENKKWLDWEGEVLIDERGKANTWVGRNFAYKPIVVKSEKNILGKFVKVKITEVKSNYLKGIVLNKSSCKL